jgi:hypothetical protein
MGRTVRIQEIVGRRAVIDEGLVGDQAGLRLGLGLPASQFLGPKTAAHR